MRSTPVQTAPRPSAPTVQTPSSAWTPAQVGLLSLSLATVAGSVLMAAAAIGLHAADNNHRDGGYLSTDPVRVHSAGHAVTVEEIDLDALSGDWLLGTARLRATAADDSSVFIGVAPSDEVADYLAGVAHSTVTELDDTEYDVHPGGAPGEAPADSDIWIAQASGPGAQDVTWEPEDGDWTIVVMNQDGSAGVDVTADVGVTAPIVSRIVHGLVAASVVAAALGALGLRFLQVSVRRRRPGGVR
jgi:hypothetical protein